jgi:O-antigen/teichoic acid export membrane protein
VAAVVNILALMVAGAGWYYIFYSRAAHRLAKLEDRRINLSRIRCRRAAGGLLALMGMLIFVGSQPRFEPHTHPRTYMSIWMVVMLLLLAVVVLAMVDLRLTLRLRRDDNTRRIDAGSSDR